MGIFYFTPILAQTTDTLGISTVYQNISLGGGDLRVTIAKIIRAVLGLLGLVAVVIVIYEDVELFPTTHKLLIKEETVL